MRWERERRNSFVSQSSIVGLYYEALAPGTVRSALGDRLRNHYATTLLLRDETYMRSLFQEHYPNALFVKVDSDGTWRQKIKGADTIVLLFPDAIGFGFKKIERELARLKARAATLSFLNGRGRILGLSRPVQTQLALRRFLIRFLVVEVLTIVPFLMATLCMAGYDRLRGRA